MYAVYLKWKKHESDESELMVQISTEFENANACVHWIYQNMSFIEQLREIDENNLPIELTVTKVIKIMNHNYNDN